MNTLRDQDANENRYTWENKIEHSWDVLEADDSTSLQKLLASAKLRMLRKNTLTDTISVHRGIIRYLVLVLDLSESMINNDMKPDRHTLMLSLVKNFVSEFFDQNPMSHLAIVYTSNGIASQLCKLNFNYSSIAEALNNTELLQPKGKASLQNSLELSSILLTNTTLHGSKEILVIFGSLSTHDPGNILHTLDKLKKNNISVSIIGYSAEIHICKIMCEQTKGSYNVIINEDHFKNLLSDCIPPKQLVNVKKAKLIEMGFPTFKKYNTLTLCMCHLTPTSKGYICPRCHSYVCSISTVCPVCNLTLISSPLLAKSYYFLFPVPAFEDVSDHYKEYSNICFGCNKQIYNTDTMSLEDNSEPMETSLDGNPNTLTSKNLSIIPKITLKKCTMCSNTYCTSCDFFIHKRLHNCLGCIANSKSQNV